LNVVYNASNNELVRMKTLVKGCIVEIDAAPFAAWYEKYYGVAIGKKRTSHDNKKKDTKKDQKKGNKKDVKKGKAIKKDVKTKKVGGKSDEKKKTVKHVKVSRRVLQKREQRRKNHKVDPLIVDQFTSGRLLARISSRPGQCGRADGYILEGPELEFYQKKVGKKRSGK